MSDVLERWNAMDEEKASEEILPCCGSRAWARRMAAARPLESCEALYSTSDLVWGSVSMEDWMEAFESHPRIGQGHANASAKSLEWSAGEQSQVLAEDHAKLALLEGNRRYEEQFGMIFIICATGKSAEEMLAVLDSRLANDEEKEVMEAAEQQRQITQIRLRKWLEGR